MSPTLPYLYFQNIGSSQVCGPRKSCTPKQLLNSLLHTSCKTPERNASISSHTFWGHPTSHPCYNWDSTPLNSYHNRRHLQSYDIEDTWHIGHAPMTKDSRLSIFLLGIWGHHSNSIE